MCVRVSEFLANMSGITVNHKVSLQEMIVSNHNYTSILIKILSVIGRCHKKLC